MGSLGLPCILVLLLFGSKAKCDLSKDREECGDQLVGLATCLPYVGGSGNAKSPSLDCCTGLRQVLIKSQECLCILIKDSDNPNLGIKINATLALGLPHACHEPANITSCPALLHLAPNSPDAKVFEDFNRTKGSNSTSAVNGKGNPSAEIRSDGGRGKRFLGVLNNKAWGSFIILVLCYGLHTF